MQANATAKNKSLFHLLCKLDLGNSVWFFLQAACVGLHKMINNPCVKWDFMTSKKLALSKQCLEG